LLGQSRDLEAAEVLAEAAALISEPTTIGAPVGEEGLLLWRRIRIVIIVLLLFTID